MAEARRILVADDEVNLRKVLAAILARDGYEVVEAGDGLEAMGLLGHGVAAIITDLKMPKLDGMGVLRRVVAERPDVPVIVITAHGSVDSAVEAVKLGAFDYIEKPFEQTQIRQVVQKAIRTFEADERSPRRTLHAAAPPDRMLADFSRFGLIGKSSALRHVLEIIAKVAETPSTVLITGESGTGKELIARALHENSARPAGPFIKVNCAAIPATLMESEMFGYEKGAFTGAVGSKPGRFELAHGGTLFLDEISSIPIEMQVKLLRVLQESEFERVGGIKTIKVDVRLVAATNRDLALEVQNRSFREDLFYRLNVVPVHIPPLRERREDIELLAQHFLGKFNEKLKKTIAGVDEGALERLRSYPWPGNIRELENVLERTILFASGPLLHASDLPAELRTTAASATGGTPPMGTESAVSGSLKELVKKDRERLERAYIVQALEATGGNVSQAARNLKISRKSLQTKMKEFGLRDKE